MPSIEEQNSITFIGVGLLKRLFSPLPASKYNIFLKFIATFFYRLLSIPVALTLIITGAPFFILKIPYLIYINASNKKRPDLYAPLIQNLYPKTRAEIRAEIRAETIRGIHEDPLFFTNKKITEKQQTKEKPQEELKYDRSLIDVERNDHW